MSSIQNRIHAFAELGNFLSQFSSKKIEKSPTVLHNDLFFDGFKHQMKVAKENNAWFTEDNILFAIESWTKALSKVNLNTWIKSSYVSNQSSKTIAIIMAGNIPLVGFHDFLSVLISGHSVLVKQSSNDKNLLPFLAKYLEYVDPSFKGKMTFSITLKESNSAPA